MNQYDIEKRLRAETDRALKKLGLETPHAMARRCVYCDDAISMTQQLLCDVCEAFADESFIEQVTDWIDPDDKQ